MTFKNRIYGGSLKKTDVGKSIQLAGWIDTIRDHGHLLFVHLRDVKGVVQLVFDPSANKEAYTVAQRLRSEYVVNVLGHVRERRDEDKNLDLPTGEIDVTVDKIDIVSEAETPPFLISEKEDEFKVDEDLRLKYRYLDLRRPSMQKNLIQRYRLIKTMRDYFDSKGFVEVETPMLTKSTPEGARDYLVPARNHPQKFYALPQSPQLFKQLLMVSGLDRYFQVVKCFRDEDLRPNRQPEFTQLDLEASFIDEEFIYELLEGLMVDLFGVMGVDMKAPFPRITYDESMALYGNDRPDIRFDMKMIDVSSHLSNVGYKIFKSILESGGKIKGITVKNQAEALSKTFIQNELVKNVIIKLGGKGLTWMKMENGKLESNVVQFFSDTEQAALIRDMNAENGDVLFFVADANPKLVDDVLGKFRVYIADYLKLIPDTFAPCWVTDFPLFEWHHNALTSCHHPFTQAQGDILSVKDPKEALTFKARAYDLVINGEEVGGGSIRIHRSDVQEKIFQLLGLSKEEIEEKFGFFVKAFQYGTPPHGGLALGLDRLTSLLMKLNSIREVIAFPKNRVAYCPMTQAPDRVSQKQLEELNLRVVELAPQV